MTPEAQRIAIAEASGFLRVPGRNLWSRHHLCLGEHFTAKRLPDYLSDLNAIHEAWKTLPRDKQCAFSLKLHEVCGTNQLNHVVNATAAQRAEAFLRTLGLWADAPSKENCAKSGDKP